MSSQNFPKPVVLIILDGWGIAPASAGNAVSVAKTPVMQRLVTSYPATTLQASGMEVGLPRGEMGNSEVGHLNLGTGRIFYQNLPRIDQAIENRSFFENPILISASRYLQKNSDAKLHLMGLLSAGGVHSSVQHLEALLEFSHQQKLEQVYLHLFLDGRDMARDSGRSLIEKLLAKIKEKNYQAKIASLAGRFFAMDRDNRWDRVEKAYRLLTAGEGEQAKSPVAAIRASYKKQVFDEEFLPTIIDRKGLIQNKDVAVFFNFRADRARQLTKAFVLPGFTKFERPEYLQNLRFITMTEYEKDLPVEVIFPPELPQTCLARVLSEQGLRQMHIAETEKYAHVSYFFNGMREEPFPLEERAIIPSPRVASYAQKSEMAAPEITKKVVEAISKDQFDFIVVNFANGDMVGHTGDLKATIKAIETVDRGLGEIVDAALVHSGIVIVTADHGNAEELQNLQTKEIDKEHSTNPVPLVLVSREFEGKKMGWPDAVGGDLSLIPPTGLLSDVAPTILKIMNIAQPAEMTGRSLI